MATILFLVIMLTTPDGTPIWIEVEHIQSIRASGPHCHGHSSAVVRFDNGSILCVIERPEEVIDRIQRR